MTVMMHVLFFCILALFFLPVLEVELMPKQINEKTVNREAVIKCCALPFVTPVSKAVCKGHHCWRCDMFTARFLQDAKKSQDCSH